MTLPDERYLALRQLPDALIDLAFREPGPIRKRELQGLVRQLLRHYPSGRELELIAMRCPSLLDPKRYGRG